MKNNSSEQDVGNCCICGAYSALTDEHIPPKATGNNKPIRLQGHEQLFDVTSRKFGSTQKSNKGFVQKRLCGTCNSFFGSNYVNPYLDFSEQIKNYLSGSNTIFEFNEFKVKIRPLAIYKQILEMLTVLSNGGFDEPERGWKILQVVNIIFDFEICLAELNGHRLC